VRTERHRGKLQQASVDASLVVSAVDAVPLPIDDIRPLTGVAQRCGCRRERGILGERERALFVDRQTLTAAAATAADYADLNQATLKESKNLGRASVAPMLRKDARRHAARDAY